MVVLSCTELSGVYENAYHYFITVSPRSFNQTEVTLMKIAHGG
ncbi:unnamed protein product, partial [marine sediment metagenome]